MAFTGLVSGMALVFLFLFLTLFSVPVISHHQPLLDKAESDVVFRIRDHLHLKGSSLQKDPCSSAPCNFSKDDDVRTSAPGEHRSFWCVVCNTSKEVGGRTSVHIVELSFVCDPEYDPSPPTHSNASHNSLNFTRLPYLEKLVIDGCLKDDKHFISLLDGAFSRIFPPRLKALTLSRNNLSGKLPSSLAKLNLTVLDLSHNSFEGSVPVEFGLFANACEINLENNNLSGRVPFCAQIGGKLKLGGNPNLCADEESGCSLGKLKACTVGSNP